MIRINLLPQQPGKAAARAASPQGGTVLVALILFVAFVVTFGVFGFFFSNKYNEEKKAAALKAELDVVKKQKADLEREYSELRDSLEVLRKQDRILQLLDPPEGRLFWAEKLNILPAYLPEGVFLTKIDVSEDVREVETRESRQAQQRWVQGGRKGRQPTKEMTPVIRQKLTLDGVAYVPEGTSDQRLERIIEFYQRLESEKVVTPFNNKEVGFLDQMTTNILFDEFDQTRVGGRPVTRFRFFLSSRPLSMDGSQ
jgi:Tfp pilus assembly protein PilN